jgi:hypothetical protein
VFQNVVARLGPGLSSSSIVVRSYNITENANTEISWGVEVGSDAESALTLPLGTSASQAGIEFADKASSPEEIAKVFAEVMAERDDAVVPPDENTDEAQEESQEDNKIMDSTAEAIVTDSKSLRKDAIDSAREHVFLILFLLYPKVSQVLFRMQPVACHRLGRAEAWHEDDFNLDCETSYFFIVSKLCLLLIVLFSLGVPVGFMVHLHRQMRKDTSTAGTPAVATDELNEGLLDTVDAGPEAQVSDTDADVAETLDTSETDDVMDEAAEDDAAKASRNYEIVQQQYDFIVSDYKPEFYYYESVELLRKVGFTGVLMHFSRGSTFQVFAGCVVSVFFLMLHMRYWPYRVHASNIVKAATDLQITLTLLISLVLRIQGDDTTADQRDGYGMLLVVLTLGFPTGAWLYARGDSFVDIYKKQKAERATKKGELKKSGDGDSSELNGDDDDDDVLDERMSAHVKTVNAAANPITSAWYATLAAPEGKPGPSFYLTRARYIIFVVVMLWLHQIDGQAADGAAAAMEELCPTRNNDDYYYNECYDGNEWRDLHDLASMIEFYQAAVVVVIVLTIPVAIGELAGITRVTNHHPKVLAVCGTISLSCVWASLWLTERYGWTTAMRGFFWLIVTLFISREVKCFLRIWLNQKPLNADTAETDVKDSVETDEGDDATGSAKDTPPNDHLPEDITTRTVDSDPSESRSDSKSNEEDVDSTDTGADVNVSGSSGTDVQSVQALPRWVARAYVFVASCGIIAIFGLRIAFWYNDESPRRIAIPMAAFSCFVWPIAMFFVVGAIGAKYSVRPVLKMMKWPLRVACIAAWSWFVPAILYSDRFRSGCAKLNDWVLPAVNRYHECTCGGFGSEPCCGFEWNCEERCAPHLSVHGPDEQFHIDESGLVVADPYWGCRCNSGNQADDRDYQISYLRSRQCEEDHPVAIGMAVALFLAVITGVVIAIGSRTDKQISPEETEIRFTTTKHHKVFAAVQSVWLLVFLGCMYVDGDEDTAILYPTFEVDVSDYRFPGYKNVVLHAGYGPALGTATSLGVLFTALRYNSVWTFWLYRQFVTANLTFTIIICGCLSLVVSMGNMALCDESTDSLDEFLNDTYFDDITRYNYYDPSPSSTPYEDFFNDERIQRLAPGASSIQDVRAGLCRPLLSTIRTGYVLLWFQCLMLIAEVMMLTSFVERPRKQRTAFSLLVGPTLQLLVVSESDEVKHANPLFSQNDEASDDDDDPDTVNDSDIAAVDPVTVKVDEVLPKATHAELRDQVVLDAVVALLKKHDGESHIDEVRQHCSADKLGIEEKHLSKKKKFDMDKFITERASNGPPLSIFESEEFTKYRWMLKIGTGMVLLLHMLAVENCITCSNWIQMPSFRERSRDDANFEAFFERWALILGSSLTLGPIALMMMYGIAAEQKNYLRIGMVAQIFSAGINAIVIVNMAGFYMHWRDFSEYQPGEQEAFQRWVLPPTRNAVVLAFLNFIVTVGLIALELKVKLYQDFARRLCFCRKKRDLFEDFGH